MFENFSVSAKQVLRLAHSTASTLGHSKVGAEHIILALFETMEPKLASEFSKLGVTHGSLLSAIKIERPQESGSPTDEITTLGPDAHIIFARANMEAKRLNDAKTDVSHIFLALEWFGISEKGNCLAWEVLMKTSSEFKIRKLIGKTEFKSTIKEDRRKSDKRAKRKSAKEIKTEPESVSKDQPIIKVDDEEVQAIFDRMLGKPDAISSGDEEPYINHEVVDLARQEALRMGHIQVGTQFVLLALSMDIDTIAGDVLNNLGLTPTRIREDILKKVGRGPATAPFETRLTEGTIELMKSAKELAVSTGFQTIESEHILLSFQTVGNRFHGSLAWEILLESGQIDKIRIAVLEELSDEKTRACLSRRKAKTGLHERAQRLRENADEPVAAWNSPAPAPATETKKEGQLQNYFSDHCLTVFTHARLEAKLFNHDFLGTEQLLLGIMADETNVGAKALSSLGITLKNLRDGVAKMVQKGTGPVSDNPPFTKRSLRVLELAFDEKRQLGGNKIEPEHLLLGILREGEGVASLVLEDLDVHLKLRSTLIKLLSKNLLPGMELDQEIEKRPHDVPENFSSISLRVVENAHAEAKSFGYPFIEPEHLLLGIVKETSNETSAIFQNRGISIKQLRSELGKLKPRGPGGSETLRASEMVKEIFALASKDAEDLVEPQDLLGYLILSLDLTTINLLRNVGLESLLEGTIEYVPPSLLFKFLHKSKLTDYFLPDAFKVILRAQELARSSGHAFCGSEHFLIAILELEEDPAVAVLLKRGLDAKSAQKEIRKAIGCGSSFVTEEIPLTPTAIDVLREAREEADFSKHDMVLPGHLILGILQLERGAVLDVLHKFGIEASIRDEIVIAMTPKSGK